MTETEMGPGFVDPEGRPIASRNDSVGRLVLDFMTVGAPVSQSRIDSLDASAWEVLSRIAAAHRLQPWLHNRLWEQRSRIKIPPAVMSDWHHARIRQARRTILIRRLLNRLAGLFEAADIPWRALKGAYLAFHAYPAAELRPLRDIDILVPESRAIETFELLLANGATRLADSPGDPAAFLATNQKHLPPIQFAQQRVRVEVHANLVVRSQSTPALSSEKILSAPPHHVDGDPVPFLDPERQLLHLIIHAVYEHKFDNGPLTFVDIERLIATSEIEWQRFWNLSASVDHVRGALLVLRLAEYFAGRRLFEHPRRADIPDSWIEALLPALIWTHPEKEDYGLSERLAGRRGIRNMKFIGGRLFRSRRELISEFGDDDANWFVLSGRLWRRLAIERAPALLRYLRKGAASPASQAMREIDDWLGIGGDTTHDVR